MGLMRAHVFIVLATTLLASIVGSMAAAPSCLIASNLGLRGGQSPVYYVYTMRACFTMRYQIRQNVDVCLFVF
jgi:hypothetical protein